MSSRPWFARFVRVGKQNVRDIAAVVNGTATSSVRAAWHPLMPALLDEGMGRLLAAERLAALVSDEMDYNFFGPKRHVIESWVQCRKRGFGACADAAAALGAGLVLCQPSRSVQLCYEDPPDAPPDYAHCRVVLDGVPVEPFPQARLEATSCSAIVDLRPLLLPAGA